MIKIILATLNAGKLREYKQLLKELKYIEFFSCRDYGIKSFPEETGVSFIENSEIKANAVFKTTKNWTISDDSGLVVPRLNGDPGIFSARYAGENAGDKENITKLLKNMEGFEEDDRNAYFECCITLIDPTGYKRNFTGRSEGYITKEPRGRNGFGYDSIFMKHDYDKTFAELDECTKNIVSHRGKAVEKLKIALEGLCG